MYDQPFDLRKQQPQMPPNRFGTLPVQGQNPEIMKGGMTKRDMLAKFLAGFGQKQSPAQMFQPMMQSPYTR